jgi:hypothetical protein
VLLTLAMITAEDATAGVAVGRRLGGRGRAGMQARAQRHESDTDSISDSLYKLEKLEHPPANEDASASLFLEAMKKCSQELEHTPCSMEKVKDEVTDCLDCARKFAALDTKRKKVGANSQCNSHTFAAFCAPAVHKFFHPNKPAIPEITETAKAQLLLSQWADQSTSVCVTEMLHSTCDTDRVTEGVVPCLECADKHWKKVHSPNFPRESFCKHKSQLVNFCNEKELTAAKADGYTSAKGDAIRAHKPHYLILLGLAGLSAALVVISQTPAQSQSTEDDSRDYDEEGGGGLPAPLQQLFGGKLPSNKKRRSLTDIEQVNYSSDQHERADAARDARTKPTEAPEIPVPDTSPSTSF